MTFREFTGKNVEEAIRSAMKEFGSDLGDLDIEILSQGSRGILGVGGEEARILAAPKSSVGAEQPPAVEAGSAPPATPSPAPPVRAAAVQREPEIAQGEEIGEDADDQAIALARAEENRRRRGGRGRGTRGRDERPERGERGGERPERREPRPPSDRPVREPAPFVPAKPMEELSESERAALEEAKAVLEELLRLMDLSGSVEVGLGAETAKLNVKGSDLGVLIGRRGEKLASLQHLVNLIVARREGQHHRIAVDVENYRGRRETQLHDVATRAAQRVIQTGKIIQLEPMPAVERRIVHVALVENAKVRTQSVGVDPNRRVVILPAEKVGS
jgi:spoIIIJ-associated protein